MTRSRDVSAVQNNLGVAIPPAAAGKNAVINGGFDIWQRGTSGFITGQYSADRWYLNGGNANASRQTTGAPYGSQYVLRVTYTANSAALNVQQYFETANISQFWGKTVVASVLLRKNSTFTSDMNLRIDKTSTVDGGVGATWTTISNTGVSNSSLPTGTTSADWYKVTSAPFTIPNDGTANGLRIYVAESSVGNSGAYYEVGQFQLELGNTATPFSRAGGTIQGELAACQRYYYRTNVTGFAPATMWGMATSTTAVNAGVCFPSTLRTAPTSLDYSLLRATDTIGVASNISTLTLGGCTTLLGFVDASGLSGFTQYRPAIIQAQASGSAYLGFSAEL